MRNNNFVLLCSVSSLLAFSPFAAAFNSEEVKNAGSELAMIVSCQKSTTPEKFVELIALAGGKSIISGNKGEQTDTEYAVPSPIDVWGFKVTHLSIHVGDNDEGDFNEYAAVIPATSNSVTPEYVAMQGQIPKIADNYYLKQFDNNDLIIRQYSDTVYVSCANDVRTLQKTINKKLKELKNN
ncbi:MULTISPECIES: hypothetical protein [Yersinia pseudotuberculosis complex]|uniref:Lipoprotein n=1 Tax=Yersinia pseudotuberculosis serotype O:1b (strain IP 31758) TaxID=349747 RepID=A0A0U1QTP8_YERP3|nr:MULTISPECIES: hypothetical protein [Yersinia pseudotuberculosis complex]ABS45757.1 hypothetical protein YpsIP31758_B0043 [Yersinia pseudotuberculosis IP 31758]MCE4113196.1 hypothetical protein [Yersinia pseudotuberculosis]RYC26214.1 hypothetical protein EU971_11045 [Yersinia pseudotuberculosis]UFA64033.1 Uncharacterized protein YP598_4424 [Yersinia pseudotuberculosis]WLF06035.1 hypothetical protein Q6G25_21490 [Yersinia pseudotuberculosis]